jgi:type VI secretion system protein ImpH
VRPPARLPRTLAARLAAAPHRFDGLHAVRLTELGLARLGTDAPPGSENTRLEAIQGLAFAPSPVAQITGRDGRQHLRIAFLGLTGPVGVLPQPYSELVQKADRLRNWAVSAFLDMFNHRLASLFVRAGEKYRLGLLLQRAATAAPARIAGYATPLTGATDPQRPAATSPERRGADTPARDPASRAMLALAGFGTPHLSGRMAVEDEVVLFYAGLFAARLRPPGALQAMLADYLGMAVRIEPFSGRWVPVAASEQTRLPRAGEAPVFATLGVDAVAGARIWDVQGNFRVVVGPVDAHGMRALMPDQPKLRKLVDLVRAYAGLDLGFDVQVVLRADSVPDLAMTAGPDAANAPRLGWNTWAKSLPALADKADIVLDPDIVMAQPGRAARHGDDISVLERT